MKVAKEFAAEWFEKMHPPGPAAREIVSSKIWEELRRG